MSRVCDPSAAAGEWLLLEHIDDLAGLGAQCQALNQHRERSRRG